MRRLGTGWESKVQLQADRHRRLSAPAQEVYLAERRGAASAHTIVGVELLDDAEVCELLDQLAVTVHSQMAIISAPRGRCRAAVISAPICLQHHSCPCHGELQAWLHTRHATVGDALTVQQSCLLASQAAGVLRLAH